MIVRIFGLIFIAIGVWMLGSLYFSVHELISDQQKVDKLYTDTSSVEDKEKIEENMRKAQEISRKYEGASGNLWLIKIIAADWMFYAGGIALLLGLGLTFKRTRY